MLLLLQTVLPSDCKYANDVLNRQSECKSVILSGDINLGVVSV